MADYAPPTLAELWALVVRYLTDPSNKVFNTSQLTDYINGGIAELNRVRPLEATHTVTWDDENDQLPLEGIPLYSVFQVELRAAYGGANSIVPNIKGGQPTRDGWDFYNGTLFLGSQWFQRAVHSARDNGWTVEVWGYRSRDPLIADDDLAEFIDLTDEMFVRLYSRMEAYRSLNVDRSLFQQWQQQANNSDVSPTQLNGMLGTAESSFDRQQKRLFLPRRVPAY